MTRRVLERPGGVVDSSGRDGVVPWDVDRRRLWTTLTRPWSRWRLRRRRLFVHMLLCGWRWGLGGLIV